MTDDKNKVTALSDKDLDGVSGGITSDENKNEGEGFLDPFSKWIKIGAPENINNWYRD